MRTLLLLLVAACGGVTTGAPQVPPDASQVPPDAAPDSPSSCPSSVVDRALPSSWVTQGPFVLVADPTGRGAQVWVSNTNVPADASFTLPFKAGDQITGLVFNAYGNGSNGGDAGLKDIELVYQPPGASNQILGMGEYFDNPAPWGHVVFLGFQSTVLSGGSVLVRFDVTEAGFYIGLVTATFERPCPSGRN
jgi:hypothetical protein